MRLQHAGRTHHPWKSALCWLQQQMDFYVFGRRAVPQKTRPPTPGVPQLCWQRKSTPWNSSPFHARDRPTCSHTGRRQIRSFLKSSHSSRQANCSRGRATWISRQSDRGDPERSAVVSWLTGQKPRTRIHEVLPSAIQFSSRHRCNILRRVFDALEQG